MCDKPLERTYERTKDAISDEDLARRAASGDETSFEVLVERYSPRIYSLAYRFLNDKGEAEDAVQEVFIRVYRALPKSKLDLAFKPWIYKIATNECINRSRRRRESAAITTEALEGVPDGASSPQDEFLEKELREILTGAIARLPKRYRRVVLLRYMEGFSFREIAETLGIPEGTAKTFFSRAKEMLRKYLAGFESDRL